MADHNTSIFHREWGRVVYFVEHTATVKLLLSVLIWWPPSVVLGLLGFSSTLTKYLSFNPEQWNYIWTFVTHSFYNPNVIELSLFIGLLYVLYPLETLVGYDNYHKFVGIGIISSSVSQFIGYVLLGSTISISGAVPIVVCLLSGFAGVIPLEKIKILKINIPFVMVPILIIVFNIILIVKYGNGLFNQSQLSYIGASMSGMLYGLYLRKENYEFDDDYLPNEVPWKVD